MGISPLFRSTCFTVCSFLSSACSLTSPLETLWERDCVPFFRIIPHSEPVFDSIRFEEEGQRFRPDMVSIAPPLLFSQAQRPFASSRVESSREKRDEQ